MVMSPVPIYLGCAGLIVGSLGLGAQYMIGGNSVSATKAESEQPLFARSVEEASLPASQWSSPASQSNWSSQNSNVAYYEPMVKLLTTPSRSVPPAPVTAAPQANAPQVNPSPQPDPPQASPPPVSRDVPASQVTEGAQQAPRAAPREVVRDIPQQTPPPKRTRNARARDDAAASAEQVDPRDAYAKANRDPRSQERQRNTTQVDNERRDTGSRRSERRYGNRDDAEAPDIRSRSDRRRVEVDEPRQRGGERRVIVREEPEQRIVRGPEQRDGGFSPFRLFGIFDR
jgi:hypothetical protein